MWGDILVILRRVGLFVIIVLVAAPLIAFLVNYKRTPGRSIGGGVRFRRGIGVFIIAIGFFTLGFLLWRPLPISFSHTLDQVMAVTGFILLISGVGLYLWGLLTLGKIFAFSSSTGADLYKDHKLIQSGPFRFTRHPMYLAFSIAALGANLLFHNWTAIILLLVSPVLIRRAKHEEKLLEAEFGEEWQAYASRVPKWFPWK